MSNFSKCRTGYLIMANGHCGHVDYKKGDLISLKLANNDRVIIERGMDIEILDDQPVYEKEEDLQRYAKDVASYHGIKMLHLNKDKTGTSKIQQAGYPDCICFGRNGVTFFIELKTQSKLSEVQIEFREWAIDNGYPHHVASIPSEIDFIYRKYGV